MSGQIGLRPACDRVQVDQCTAQVTHPFLVALKPTPTVWPSDSLRPSVTKEAAAEVVAHAEQAAAQKAAARSARRTAPAPVARVALGAAVPPLALEAQALHAVKAITVEATLRFELVLRGAESFVLRCFEQSAEAADEAAQRTRT